MTKVIQKSIYGSVAILKGYCKNCKENSFIIDGFLSCCNSPVSEIPKTERIKRETEAEKKRSYIPIKMRNSVLKEQDYKCIYCSNSLRDPFWNNRENKYTNLKIHYDHFLSWNYSGDNHQNNIFAACHICNGIKSDKYFYDLISAREHILERRKEKGY